MFNDMSSCRVDLSKVAKLLRPVSTDVSKGMGKLCLSVNYLHYLNKAFEEIVAEDGQSSFNAVHRMNGTTSNTIIRDIQFLWNLVKATIALKLTPDLVSEGIDEINLVRFKNVKILEVHKIDLAQVFGIQRLRSQLQEIVCTHNLRNLNEVLTRCGGDNSHGNIWSELKRAGFSHNSLTTLDNSLELTPWLQSLDLSYNQISKAEFLGHLPNLKYLNLSYNCLDKVPKFKGQICTRIQILILNNNFIEDLSGLQALSTLVHVDLHQNCIYDHDILLNVSHLSALQSLNLQENPVSLHPQHRTITCNYLHKNIVTTKFLLNGTFLNKKEKVLAGSLYPLSHCSLSYSSNSSENSIENSMQERQKKIRNVKIEDFSSEIKTASPSLTPTSSLAHLQIKKQIEQLRQEYGTSWLYQDSGRLIQDVLGLEKSTVLSSTPSDNGVDSLYVKKNILSSTESVSPSQNTSNQFIINAEVNFLPNTADDKIENNRNIPENSDETCYTTAQENNATEVKDDFKTALDGLSIFDNKRLESDVSDVSDGEDIYEGGEKGIFLASLVKESSDLDSLIVVTGNHISERDVTSSKEKARWHLNIVLTCEKLDENGVKLTFDTVRRDRKERIYYLEEPSEFLQAVNEKIPNVKRPENMIPYECMKCSDIFQKAKISEVLKKHTISCPKCESNMVVEKI